jgi:methylated-DNA-[protein]-cysteine S-methyltransferase
MKSLLFCQTPIGSLGIVESDGALTHLYFEGESVPGDAVEQETALLKETGRQLQLYFSGQLRDFSLPLAPNGTEYMRRVWESLCAIPYGETRSYREIAQSLGNPKAARAVGLANNKNPLPLFIPCHRVIGSNQKLVGYRGGLPVKHQLLQLEKAGG